MVTCELDQDVSGEVLGWKLPPWQALVLHRVLPSCGGLIIYLSVICFDFALVFEHFINKEKVIGSLCIILIILPAVISTVFSLSSPPPNLQTELTAYDVNIDKKGVKWIFMQIANCIFFPLAAIGRYCYLIFWWVEVVCAAYVEDEERTQDALTRAKEASPVELYLFLQAFLHSAPHAIVNILSLMSRFNDPDFDTATLQAVSIVVSCMRMSSTATFYRRFEREKLNGKRYPWSESNESLIKDKPDEDADDSTGEPIYEAIKSQPFEVYNPVISTNERVSLDRRKITSDMIEFSPRSTLQDVMYDDIHTDSDSGSEYTQPISYRDHSRRSPTSNSDDEYVRPISIIDRVAPRRSSTYTIEKVEITPPPIIPAPRPASLAGWAEKFVENAESIPTWLSAPHRRKYNDEVILAEPDLPRYVPNNRKRGLEPQDATAALVQYLGWYSFFISRLLSIAAFINLSIIASVMILFSHYQIMLLLLIVPQASTVKRGFYIFLAFIYLFCLMEFKVRFRHVRVWHVFWTISCAVEIIVFTGLWVAVDNQLHHWWKTYITKVIFVSLLLSLICFSVYFILLKPKETIVTVNKNTKK